MKKRKQQQNINADASFLGEGTGILAGDITSAKVEVISSMILTIGYSLATLSTILALQEEEQLAQARTSDAQNQNLQFRHMHKHLQNLNNRLDSIERKLNRY